MDIKQLETFICVAKFKSFSKAADAIFLSQPAISAQISSLERELSMQLFDRNSKEVNLTPAGELFMEYAVEIVDTYRKAYDNLMSFNGNVSGKLNLAASTTPCNCIVPALVKEFRDMYPEVNFNICEQSSGDIIENILKLNYEIGITGKGVKDDKLKSYMLMQDDLVVISNPSLELPDTITMDMLKKHNFIVREKGSATRKTFEDAISGAGLNDSDIKIVCEVNNIDTVFQFVKAGLGISVVSSNVCNDYLSSGKIKASKIQDLDLVRSIYLIISSKRTLSPAAKAFFELCRERFGFEE